MCMCSSLTSVVVDPLLPDYWGESASVDLWGFAASFSRQSSRRAATPEGSLHKSRADSVVGSLTSLYICPLCNHEDGDLEHFLLMCESLKSTKIKKYDDRELTLHVYGQYFISIFHQVILKYN